MRCSNWCARFRDEHPQTFPGQANNVSCIFSIFRREVTLDLVDDFFSGPISISWRKLSRYVFEQRAVLDRETAFEWFQWLAERMIEREKQTPPTPAHIAHRDWK